MQSAAKRDHIIRLGAAGAAEGHHDQPTMPVDPGALGSETEEHAAHCHVGPAHCGGGESMIGTPFVGDDNGGLALSGHESEIDTESMLAAVNGHAKPILQPPRSA